MMTAEQEIQLLLQAFQDGYTHRDLTQVDTFMELFTHEAEVIGTNGVKPGLDEWYTSRAAARELVHGDWEGWGDFRLDLDSVSIHSLGEVGWLAATATVTQTIGEENYASYLDFVKEYLERPGLSAEQKLNYILRGGTNTIYELRRGKKIHLAAAPHRCRRAPARRLEICPDELLLPDGLFSRCAHHRK